MDGSWSQWFQGIAGGLVSNWSAYQFNPQRDAIQAQQDIYQQQAAAAAAAQAAANAQRIKPELILLGVLGLVAVVLVVKK